VKKERFEILRIMQFGIQNIRICIGVV